MTEEMMMILMFNHLVMINLGIGLLSSA